MDFPLKPALQRLGMAVAQLQDVQAQRVGLVQRTRAVFLTRAARLRDAPERRSTGWWSHLAFAGIGALAGVGALALWTLNHPALTFTVGPERRDGHVGDAIAALDQRPVPVRFSDGTSLVFDAGSVARVTALRASGGDVAIETGTVHAAVVHTGQASWVLRVGVYDVRVTGTQLTATWDSARRRAFIAVGEGSVVVSGCALAPRELVGGQELRAECAGLEPSLRNPNDQVEAGSQAVEGNPSPATAANPAAVRMTQLAEPVPVRLEPELPGSSQPAPVASTTASLGAETSAGAQSWRQLARDRRYAEAMSRIGGEFDRECQSASAPDLLLLSDAARFAGQHGRAKQALQTLRLRFPADPLSAVAAFHLGRAASDGGQTAEALFWFQTSVRENPNGWMARETMGRLIELHQALGRAAEARQLAAEYLSRFPTGPHASLARTLLEN